MRNIHELHICIHTPAERCDQGDFTYGDLSARHPDKLNHEPSSTVTGIEKDSVRQVRRLGG